MMNNLDKYTQYSDDLDAFDTTYSGLHEYGYQTDNK